MPFLGAEIIVYLKIAAVYLVGIIIHVIWHQQPSLLFFPTPVAQKGHLLFLWFSTSYISTKHQLIQYVQLFQTSKKCKAQLLCNLLELKNKQQTKPTNQAKPTKQQQQKTTSQCRTQTKHKHCMNTTLGFHGWLPVRDLLVFPKTKDGWHGDKNNYQGIPTLSPVAQEWPFELITHIFQTPRQRLMLPTDKVQQR